MTPLAVAIGVGADAVFGEPPPSLHPVAWFGRAMARIERRTYRSSRPAGVLHLVAGVGLAGGTALVLRRLTGRHPATVLLTAICTAGKMLDDEALAVAAHLEAGDLTAARTRIRSLVGRRTATLEEADLSRAVIESVAENGVDAVIATIFWGALAGPAGIAVHRAVNTLDAMVGHRTERYQRFGWAAARADDVMNYVPARLAAGAVAAATPRRARQVWTTVRGDARRHPSPNGGVVEAAFAAALGVRLGGVNVYVDGHAQHIDDRGTLGDGSPPTTRDIRRAVTLRRRSTLVVVACSLTCAVTGRCVRARRGSSPLRATRRPARSR